MRAHITGTQISNSFHCQDQTGERENGRIFLLKQYSLSSLPLLDPKRHTAGMETAGLLGFT
jgi:hypothetical protein